MGPTGPTFGRTARRKHKQAHRVYANHRKWKHDTACVSGAGASRPRPPGQWRRTRGGSKNRFPSMAGITRRGSIATRIGIAEFRGYPGIDRPPHLRTSPPIDGHQPFELLETRIPPHSKQAFKEGKNAHGAHLRTGNPTGVDKSAAQPRHPLATATTESRYATAFSVCPYTVSSIRMHMKLRVQIRQTKQQRGGCQLYRYRLQSQPRKVLCIGIAKHR